MPSDKLLLFVLKRRQFSIILSYAMTIHKAQGQTFEKVGVYLHENVFSHGQLYVAISRVRNKAYLKIQLDNIKNNKTKNILYENCYSCLKKRLNNLIMYN